ncbi:reverse transcriptase domain-containing protein [Tanacetum coccineum]|uniref:Reverse transcriptase domain-containing protein n=1 Tax=Tanacetum coccineum TaxID=301880 RepID=A0ABQ5FNB3_9ASTR
MLKAYDKDLTEISKIVRKANETLPNFKEMWVSESNAIPNVPELMQISSFMISYKCPELAKRFSDSIPKTVDELLKRVDDYLRSEEAFRNTELPKGEFQQKDPPHSSRILSNRTPTAPTAASAAGGSTQQGKLKQDVRQRGRTGKWSNGPQKSKALVVEAEVEGYLVRRIHVDEGASVEIMFEQCFNMLHPSIRARLVETQTTISGFSGEQVKPLGKIELDVCFGGSGLCRRAIMKFTIIPAPSPYNIILGCPGLKQLRVIPSTIHEMMKFPTPWGIATLVSQEPIIFEFKTEGKKQAIECPEETEPQEKVSLTEQVLVNPAYPGQLIVIGKGLSPKGSVQLKNLLKKHKDIFAWEPADRTGVPKRIIKHSLNANPLITPESQKRRVFCFEKSKVITQEVSEWLKAGIVRPVKYPTWISNPFLVKKVDGS